MFDSKRTVLRVLKINETSNSIMKHRYFSLAILCLILISLSAASQDYTHDQKLYFGDSIDINDYVIDYNTNRDGQEVLEIGRWTGSSFRIIDEIEGLEIYNSKNENTQISENISLVIERTGYDRDGRFIELNISATKDFFSSGELSSNVPDKIIISQGESANIPLTLENQGYINQTYSLRSETNSSLTTSFSYQDFNVTDVYVPSQEEESVSAKIEVPDAAELGTYDLELVAENFTTFSEKLQVEIRGAEVERDIELDLRESYTQAESGEELEFDMWVRNRGASYRYDSGGVSLENVELDAKVPEGWDYSFDTEAIEQLQSRESRRVVLNVDVPDDTQSGDFFVEASASSDKTSMEEPKEVRVNIREKSGMGVVGVLLMALSLGLLIFVYRKFGRR